mgnify:FL=1
MLSFVDFTKIYCDILKLQILLFRAKINKKRYSVKNHTISNYIALKICRRA